MLNTKLSAKAAAAKAAAVDDDADDDDNEPAGAKHAVPEIRWVKWFNLELELNDRKIAYTYQENLAIADIDVRRSRQNHARLGPAIIDENVAAMVQRARRHGILEMIPLVAWWTKGPKPQLVLCDGNNRDESMIRLGVQLADMYILTDPGPKTIELVTQICNGLIGLGSNHEERIDHAVNHYLDNPGISYKAAAATQAISAGLLSQRVKIALLARRFAVDGDLTVPGFQRFNPTSLGYLAQLVPLKNDTVLQHAAAQLLTIVKLKHTHVEALQAAVRATKPSTQEAQIATIDAEIARYKAEQASDVGPKRGPESKPHKLLKVMRSLTQTLAFCFDDGSVPKDVLNELAQRSEYSSLSKYIKGYLAKVDKGL